MTDIIEGMVLEGEQTINSTIIKDLEKIVSEIEPIQKRKLKNISFNNSELLRSISYVSAGLVYVERELRSQLIQEYDRIAQIKARKKQTHTNSEELESFKTIIDKQIKPISESVGKVLESKGLGKEFLTTIISNELTVQEYLLKKNTEEVVSALSRDHKNGPYQEQSPSFSYNLVIQEFNGKKLVEKELEVDSKFIEPDQLPYIDSKKLLDKDFRKYLKSKGVTIDKVVSLTNKYFVNVKKKTKNRKTRDKSSSKTKVVVEANVKSTIKIIPKTIDYLAGNRSKPPCDFIRMRVTYTNPEDEKKVEKEIDQALEKKLGKAKDTKGAKHYSIKLTSKGKTFVVDSEKGTYFSPTDKAFLEIQLMSKYIYNKREKGIDKEKDRLNKEMINKTNHYNFNIAKLTRLLLKTTSKNPESEALKEIIEQTNLKEGDVYFNRTEEGLAIVINEKKYRKKENETIKKITKTYLKESVDIVQREKEKFIEFRNKQETINRMIGYAKARLFIELIDSGLFKTKYDQKVPEYQKHLFEKTTKLLLDPSLSAKQLKDEELAPRVGNL